MLLFPITSPNLDRISGLQTFQREGFELCFRRLVRVHKGST